MTDTTETAALPDLRSALTTEEAGEAAAAVLGRRAGLGTIMRLGALTDEELVAALGDVETAAPLGHWYPTLDEATATAVRTAAMRSLASREEVVFDTDTEVEGGIRPRVGQRLLGLLRLRLEQPRALVEVLTGTGPAWYVLRRGEAGWMREVVTQDGFHAFDLLELDEGEANAFGAAVHVVGGAAASEVDLLQPEGDDAPAEVADFLAGQIHVARVRLTTGEADERAFVVAVGTDGAVTLGEPHEGGLRYRGASAAEVLEIWQEWLAAQQ